MSIRFLSSFVMALALITGCGPSRTKVHLDAGPELPGAEADGGRDGGHPGGVDGGTSGGTDGGSPQGPGVHLDGGSAAILTVANWNMEWFGDSTPGHGPSDEALQYANARDVLRDAGVDIYGLVEVVSPTAFKQLLSELPDYRGVLASDSTAVTQPVTCDSSGATPCYTLDEQKPALLYKPSVATVRSAQLILASPAYGYDLAGRPPLRVDLAVTVNGFSTELVVIVLHLKAYSDTTSYQRRANASKDLKQYLDANLAGQKVLVVGDWNDDVDQSTASSNGFALPTPFLDFVKDPDHYAFVTGALTVAGARSTVSFPNMIDHHLATRPLLNQYLADSAEVLRPDLWGQSDYAYGSYTTTSDHYPVESRYVLGVAAPDGGVDAGTSP